ncbi:hypothetical protein BSZ16_00145, partial [Bradyrhizobium canariense]
PNLASRANKYVLYLIQRYAFAMEGLSSPVTAQGEAPWFVAYAIGATLYRLSIMITIALLVASKLFFLGIALAILSVVNTLVWPAINGLRFVRNSPLLQRQRRRAIAVTAGTIAAALIAVLAIPMPFATMAQGGVWVGEQSTVRALSDGFVSEIAAQNGQWVK